MFLCVPSEASLASLGLLTTSDLAGCACVDGLGTRLPCRCPERLCAWRLGMSELEVELENRTSLLLSREPQSFALVRWLGLLLLIRVVESVGAAPTVSFPPHVLW